MMNEYFYNEEDALKIWGVLDLYWMLFKIIPKVISNKNPYGKFIESINN